MAEEPPERPSSYGNVGEHHWTRTRKETNREAIEYYRERSKAPGVKEGGGPRNFYCMECDGVVPFDHDGAGCPHCGAALEGQARRYFNWVEIDRPPASDFKVLLPWLLGGLALAGLLGWLFFRLVL